MRPEDLKSCNSTACVEIINEYNAGLCAAAASYNHEAIASFVHYAETKPIEEMGYSTSIAGWGPIDVANSSLNWSDALSACGQNPDTIKKDLDLLLAGEVLIYQKVRDAEQAFAARRKALAKEMGLYIDPIACVNETDVVDAQCEISTQVEAIQQIQYDMQVKKVVAPKISEVNRGDIEQWKVKTAWEELPVTGVALVDWATRFEFLRAKEQKLYTLSTSSRDPKIIDDASKALLLCFDLKSSLGNPPAAPVAEKTAAPTNEYSNDVDEDEVAMGPAFVNERGAKKVYAGPIQSPDMSFGFGTKNTETHRYELAFWGALQARLKSGFVTTLLDNQQEFLRRPARARYKDFDPRETFTEALSQTVADMAMPDTAALIEVDKRLKGSDMDLGCTRIDEVDRYYSHNSPSYVTMEGEYLFLCQGFELSKALYTKQDEGIFKFHPEAFINADAFGTAADPRLRLITRFATIDTIRVDVISDGTKELLGL